MWVMTKISGPESVVSKQRRDRRSVAAHENVIGDGDLSVRGLFERFEENEPAFAVGARAAGKCGSECELERRDFPAALGTAALHRDRMGLQEVLRRSVIAVFVLDVVEDRELPSGAHVDFELAHTVHNVIVHALGIAAVGFPT
jgi:hypothetical protein